MGASKNSAIAADVIHAQHAADWPLWRLDRHDKIAVMQSANV